jgi:hypothetical protein
MPTQYMPLVGKINGIAKAENYQRTNPRKAAFYRMAELYLPIWTHCSRKWAHRKGKLRRADTANFANGGVTMVTGVLE